MLIGYFIPLTVFAILCVLSFLSRSIVMQKITGVLIIVLTGVLPFEGTYAFGKDLSKAYTKYVNN